MILHQDIVLELPLLHVSVGEDPLGQAVQAVDLELAFFESSVWDEAAVAVELVGTSLQRNKLALKKAIWPRLVALPNNTPLTKIDAVFDGCYFFNSFYSKIFIEF